MRRLNAALLFAAMCVTPAFGASIADTYVIPVAGHTSGANGEVWKTDVMLYNVGTSTVVVDVVPVGFDTSAINPLTVSVPPRGTVALRDVMGERSWAGALLVAGDAPFTLSSRIYAEGPRGSFGESIPAVAEFANAASPESVLTGLIANQRQRTNIGFFALAQGSDLDVEIEIVDASGASLGSRRFVVAAGTTSHVQVSSRAIAPASFDAATALVRIVSGDGLLAPYASVVDNASSDSTFIPALISLGSINPSALRRLVVR